MTLEEENPHPRDSLIKFEEKGHKYTVEGVDGKFKSVTSLIHDFFPKFDSDKIIRKMMSSADWEMSKYFDMSVEEIKDLWSSIASEANFLGTAMHADIENYINGLEVNDSSTIEFKYFLSYWKFLMSKSYTPYRTEWRIFDEIYLVAGSIDFAMKDENGDIVLIDWKRYKEIKKTNKFEKGYPPFHKLDNCNYIHASIQLNIYKYILESRYDVKVSKMYICVLHPNNVNYRSYPIKNINIGSVWSEITSQ